MLPFPLDEFMLRLLLALLACVLISRLAWMLFHD